MSRVLVGVKRVIDYAVKVNIVLFINDLIHYLLYQNRVQRLTYAR